MVKRAVVEKFDVLLQAENGLLSRAHARVKFHRLNGRVAIGKVQSISQERSRWNGARPHEFRRYSLARSEVISGGEMQPRGKSQVVRGDVAVVEGM